MALAQENKLPKSLEILKQAVSQHPDNPSLRLSLAKLHLKAGDRAAAREELERLGALGETFRGHKEVQRLQAQL